MKPRVASAIAALLLVFIGAPLILAVCLGVFAARPPTNRNRNNRFY